MNACNYTLLHSEAAWKDALNALKPYLPDGVSAQNVQALKLLPIFAVILVIDNQSLDDDSPDALMQAWADAQNHWVVRAVPYVGEKITLSVDKDGGACCQDTPHKPANVSVFRYILMPTNKDEITPDKKDAAAHIIDEQLTAYLRKKLRPKPDYNYKVDKSGQIKNFTLGAQDIRPRVDCHILSIGQMLRRHKLACFDMDSTLIKQEVIVELARRAGVYDKVEEITEEAMRGQIDFASSFAQRLALLKDLDASVIDEVCQNLTLQPGAKLTILALKQLGFHTALISGGFEPFAKHITNLLGIHEYHANALDIENGKLTGEVVMPILDGAQKARLVGKITDRLSIDLDEVVCVGDGANDLPMMAISDIGIAYKAKAIVKARADVAVDNTGLEGVLYSLGYPSLRVQHHAD